MKKILALALAMALVMSCGVAAWADGLLSLKGQTSVISIGGDITIGGGGGGTITPISGDITIGGGGDIPQGSSEIPEKESVTPAAEEVVSPVSAPDPVDNTIYFDVADFDIQTGKIEVSGANADGVTAYSQTDHAGVTFAASLLKADGANDIHVFNGEEELSSDAYDCYFHRDGSMSLTISNTYLLTNGAGDYSFKALVNEAEANFGLTVDC